MVPHRPCLRWWRVLKLNAVHGRLKRLPCDACTGFVPKSSVVIRHTWLLGTRLKAVGTVSLSCMKLCVNSTFARDNIEALMLMRSEWIQVIMWQIICSLPKVSPVRPPASPSWYSDRSRVIAASEQRLCAHDLPAKHIFSDHRTRCDQLGRSRVRLGAHQDR